MRKYRRQDDRIDAIIETTEKLSWSNYGFVIPGGARLTGQIDPKSKIGLFHTSYKGHYITVSEYYYVRPSPLELLGLTVEVSDG